MKAQVIIGLSLVALLVAAVGHGVATAAEPYKGLTWSYDQQNTSGPSMGPAPAGPACEWVESRVEMGTPACGYNDLLAPKAGVFRCGSVNTGSRCERRCFFIECVER